MVNIEEGPMIDVPQSWLNQIADLAEKVHNQMDKLPPEAYTTFIKTDISALLGYASSARTIVKLKGIARRNDQ
jgi:hypothetical protein